MEKTDNEEYLVAAGRGKWSQPGIPHKGWTCIDIEDLGEPQTLCEMCESQTIRYVHHMEHPNYDAVLAVGCVCAGHMESNVVAARNRESAMKSRASKRKRWLSRTWRISAKGNPWINSDGYRVTIYRKGIGWAATVSKQDDSFVHYGRLIHKSQDLAKLSAFDHITKLGA